MKKIVALALALALALSLCTVAFADSTTLTAKDYKLVDKTNATVATFTTLVAYAQSVSSTTVDGKTTTTTTPAYYVGTDANKVLVVVDSSEYTCKLVKDGAVVAYVAELSSVDNVPSTSDTVTKVTVGKDGDDAVCGDYVGEDINFFTVDKTVYQQAAVPTNGKADTTVKFALLNGNLVAYSTTSADNVLVKHAFKDNGSYKFTYTDNTGKTVATAYCYNCKQYVPVVKASAIPAASTDSYKFAFNVNTNGTMNTAATAAMDAGTNYYFLESVSTAAAASTTTTVDSSQTFDAGVAMYVGLSLMSVAGSAVVIGKKKEF